MLRRLLRSWLRLRLRLRLRSLSLDLQAGGRGHGGRGFVGRPAVPSQARLGQGSHGQQELWQRGHSSPPASRYPLCAPGHAALPPPCPCHAARPIPHLDRRLLLLFLRSRLLLLLLLRRVRRLSRLRLRLLRRVLLLPTLRSRLRLRLRRLDLRAFWSGEGLGKGASEWDDLKWRSAQAWSHLWLRASRSLSACCAERALQLLTRSPCSATEPFGHQMPMKRAHAQPNHHHRQHHPRTGGCYPSQVRAPSPSRALSPCRGCCAPCPSHAPAPERDKERVGGRQGWVARRDGVGLQGFG